MAHVLYFSRDYSTHDHHFLSALARSQHRVSYLRLEQRGHPLEDRPLPPEVEQVSWAGGHSPAKLRHAPRLWADLRRVIRRLQPDLIQAGPLQTAALLAALTGFRPLISTSWGYDLLQDAQRNPFWEWATRYTLRRSAVMVGDCNTIRQLAIRYGMPDERIVTFPWGVDLAHFSPGTKGEDGNLPAFTLLSTRGWEPVYGVDVLAQSFCQAARQVPELRLVMLGNGSLAERLRQLFDREGLSERVFFPGQVGQTNLPGYYRSADLYVSASHSDGTSISLLEAMACGCPALVSDIPGNREWVTPGANGWLFPDGDASALAECLLRAWEARARLPEMGAAARRLAEQRADWTRNFPHLLRAYDLALSRAR
ncbi:MAG: glycosyltransferase family 4 protein [Anaerolineales bacterium]|nr:glycosyltransferase family 4 protein [Anaerolineales bacterium]